MIEYGKRDMFKTDAECIVNTVNCQVHKLYARMHRNPEKFETAQKGVAGQFETRLPASQGPLLRACERGLMKPGMVLPVELDKSSGRQVPRGEGNLLVAHVATKDYWADPSKMDWVKSGAEKLAHLVEERNIRSIAIPPLGAGLGKLEWAEVQRVIHNAFKGPASKGVRVMVLGEDVLGLGDPGRQGPAATAAGTEGSEKKGSGRIYAGIGSRKTTPAVYAKMTELGQIMAREGVELRSGGADGSDDAFEKGAISENGPMKIFLPSQSFKGRQADGDKYICHVTDAHMDLAREYHPAWDRLGGFARKLMARNGSQLMGKDLDAPADLVMCFTPSGKIEGGTGQAMRMANSKGVPVLNIGAAPWKGMSAEEIGKSALKVIRKEASLDEVEKEAVRSAPAAHYRVIGGDQR